jgi:hypothetical protein
LITDHNWAITDAGLGPCVSVTPDPLAFPDSSIGLPSERTVTVTNSGGAGLVMPPGALTVTGPDAGQFTIGADSCSGATIPAGGSCVATVSFSPTSSGSKAAGLRISSNAVTSPTVVPLTGSGLAPAFSAIPTSLDFGAVRIGRAGGPQAVTVRNDGPGVLALGDGAVRIAGPGFGTGADTCSGARLATGDSCTVEVRFSPTVAGAASGVLTFTSNAPGGPHTVSLRGTGTAALKKQTLAVKLPKRIKLSGLTVITPAGARTNAGQRVRTVVRGGPITATVAGQVRYFTVVRGPRGKVAVRTFGYRDLRLSVTQKAPAVERFTAFERQATYTKGRRG